ncbi:MAG: hypothetical protein K5945_03205 [Bacteroidaceae bacterium]|nr:hypothetical protein [Bacteroidaceae bacterium]
MKRFFILFALMMLLPLCATSAPKGKEKAKEPAPVKLRTLRKAAKLARKNSAGQPAAETNLLAALPREDISDKQRAEIFYLCAQLEENLNGMENKKAYLKAKYDTATLFTKLLTMYQFLEKCDSVDAIPNEKGYVHLSYKGKTHSLRMKHRRNIYNGGNFFLGKRNYAMAYSFFDYYYQVTDPKKDDRLPKIAYWAALCGYMAQQPERTLKYIDRAIEVADSAQKPTLQEYKARSYLLQKNEPAWIAALDTGLMHYPTYDYFFVNKEDWYYSQRKFDEGIALADSLVKHAADKALYWYAMCRMAYAKNDFEACIVYADSTIRRDPNFTDAYYNKGISLLNLAIIAQESVSKDMSKEQWREDRKTMQDFYLKAKPCMEMVRKLEPKNPERWASALYRIYLNLNMGAEFDEIDKLLKAQKENKG